MTPLLLSALMLLTAPEERFDHHGALGLLVAAEGEHLDSNVSGNVGWGGSVNVGGTMSIGWASNEVMLMARSTFGEYTPPPPPIPPAVAPPPDHRLHAAALELYGGLRGYFGDRFKTLYEINVGVTFTPYVTAGPRVAVGIQYELTNTIGIFLTIGAQLGFGETLQFRGELMIGFHFRSFLLE
jgi:hypothetical protein